MIKKTSCMLLIAVLLLASCKPVQMYFIDREGPPDYVQGFDDGCQSGISSGGSILRRLFYWYKKDPERLDNKLYTQGWGEGWGYCRFTITAPEKY